jgi:hypothetical protein
MNVLVAEAELVILGTNVGRMGKHIVEVNNTERCHAQMGVTG